MKTKIQIKSTLGKVLFEYEKENNTIKDTVEEAVRNGVNLSGANLRCADLRNANLCGVNFCGANLIGADLDGANLCWADLRVAKLEYTYLGNADLCGTNLSGVYLRYTDFGEFGKLFNNQDILIVGPIGSRSSYTTFLHTDKGIFVQCGCFKGTLDEFVSKVKETHKNNKYAQDYLALVEFVKLKFK